MREVNKALAKTVLTREDIINDSSEQMGNLRKMLNTEIYVIKVKLALYKKEKLSARGFLMNRDVYVLPLGKKDHAGTIYIDSDVMDILGRYLLANKLADQGDALTAFLIEHDDKLYELFKEMRDVDPADRIKDDEYIQLFNITYNRVSEKLAEHDITIIFDDYPELRQEYLNFIEDEYKRKPEEDGDKKTD